MIKLNPEQIKIINEHVLSEYPKEAVLSITQDSAIPLKNISDDPVNTFKVCSKEFYKTNPISLLHSHTKNVVSPTFYIDPRTPSIQDMKLQKNINLPCGITYTDGENIMEPIFFPDLDSDIFGQNFIYGVYDCYRVVRKYYKDNYNIILPEFIRDGYNEDQTVINNFYKEAGFYEIPFTELKQGDVIIYKYASEMENHMAIYLNSEHILHHINNKVSGYDSFPKWNRRATKYLRYKK
jgi:hypothetical protein